jgi:hypothetical protein
MPNPGSGTDADAITIRVSGDRYQGNPQFTISVDGKQVGGVQTVTAAHAKGEWQDIVLSGDFGAQGPQEVELHFVNDANDGRGGDGHDRNLFVDFIEVNGDVFEGESAAGNTAALGYHALDPNAAVMVAGGTVSFSTADAAPVATPAPAPAPAPTPSFTLKTADFSDGHGHDIFVFDSVEDGPARILGFDPGEDIIDVAPALRALGYSGEDPFAAGVLRTVDDDAGTIVMLGEVELALIANVQARQLDANEFWH